MNYENFNKIIAGTNEDLLKFKEIESGELELTRYSLFLEGYRLGYDRALKSQQLAEKEEFEEMDKAYDEMSKGHCTKCGDAIMSEENALCGRCI